MATLNKVMLIGRLTANPEEPRTLPNSGNRVIKFRFAVGRSRKNPQTGSWEPDPNQLYVDCEAFSRPDTKRDLVSLIQQYVKQGDPLYIEGRLQLDEWQDKTTGQKRSKHKIVVDGIELLGSRGEGEGGGGMASGSGMAGGGRSGGANGSNGSNGGGRPPAGGRSGGGFSPPPANDGDDDFGGGEYTGGGGDTGDKIPF